MKARDKVNLDVDGTVVLKRILKKLGVVMWVGMFWPMMVSIGGF
jgi:hypothetical protein